MKGEFWEINKQKMVLPLTVGNRHVQMVALYINVDVIFSMYVCALQLIYIFVAAFTFYYDKNIMLTYLILIENKLPISCL